MTASEKLNLIAKIAQDAEDRFPDYTDWFRSEVEAGRLTFAQFSLGYNEYKAEKMRAVKRAIAAAFPA